ncbi:MAG: ABC transporter permease [Acidimicrobiales bacterium]|nr:ABC transporter permease [Acidimicrobiales bacterium]
MTASTTAATVAPAEEVHHLQHGVVSALRDSWIEATRHLRVIPRNADLLIFATLQPIMFVVLFRYVFGGSITIPGFTYNQYLMPGIFAQTVVFGSAFTGIGIAEDMQKGFIDRLRSLPISQSAVLIGRTVSDTLRNMITFAVMLAVAFAIGFRFDGGLLRGIAATALLLAFAYAFSWIQALIGLSVKSVEAANSAGFIWMFPMTFVSSAFVDTASMPTWLGKVADANPFTLATNAARALYNGRDPGNSVWQALLWAAGITVVFAFLTIRRFTTTATRG